VKTRELHRAARRKVPFPVVALVGYTNAGKSTLFNRLTGAEVLAKDMLFATLDPTMRAMTLPTGLKVILSDTVGFISDLPTQLVAAFRATLEEVLEADLILHVRDIAHGDSAEQAEDVGKILAELGVSRQAQVVPLSALTGDGIADLSEAIAEALDETRLEADLVLPFAEGRRRAWLHAEGIVVAEREDEGGHVVTVRWTARQRARFETL
jgi:GTPase